MARMAFAIVAVCACGGDEGATLKSSIGVPPGQLQAFAVAGPRGTPRLVAPATGAPEVLYALSPDGALTPVSVTDDENGTTIYPVAVFDTPALVFMAYPGLTCADTPDSVVVMRKSDGALFCIPESGAFTSRFDTEPTPRKQILSEYFSHVQSDDTGNVVWLNGPDLIQIDFSDPEAPVSTRPIDASLSGSRAVDGGNGGFAVNSDGDAFYANTFSSPVIRVQRAGGGFVNAGSVGGACVVANGADFFYLADRRVMHVPKSSGFTLADLGELIPVGGSGAGSWNCAHGLAAGADFVLFTREMGNELAAFSSSPSPSVTLVPVTDFTTITRIIAGGSDVLILGTDMAGNSGVVRYRPGQTTFTTVIAPGTYAIGATGFSVSSDGGITFQGQRSSDGALVFGSVAPGSTEVVISSEMLPDATQLVRID